MATYRDLMEENMTYPREAHTASSGKIRYAYLNHFFHRTMKSIFTVFKAILAIFLIFVSVRRGHWPVSDPRDCNTAGRLYQSGFGAGQGSEFSIMLPTR